MEAKWLIDSYNKGKRKFVQAKFAGASLRRAHLISTDFRYCNFSNTDLGGAKLSHCNFSGADLRGANIGNADLSGANLSGVDFFGAHLCCTNFQSACFVSAKNIQVFGPAPNGHMLYAVKHTDGYWVQIGDFWGSTSKLRHTQEENKWYISVCDFLDKII